MAAIFRQSAGYVCKGLMMFKAHLELVLSEAYWGLLLRLVLSKFSFDWIFRCVAFTNGN